MKNDTAIVLISFFITILISSCITDQLSSRGSSQITPSHENGIMDTIFMIKWASNEKYNKLVPEILKSNFMADYSLHEKIIVLNKIRHGNYKIISDGSNYNSRKKVIFEIKDKKVVLY